MSDFKPSELAVVAERREGLIYNPSNYLRYEAGVLQQMWWSQAADAVWEDVPQGNNLSLADIALGRL